jgi:hypothetical protein
VALVYIPKIYKPKNDTSILADRPQASFLPKVPNRGTLEPLPQKESERYARENNITLIL